MGAIQRIAVTRDVTQPPGGWKLTVPQTGVTVTAPFYKVLKSRVLAHMTANGITEDDFDAWCQDAACRESGHGRPFCGAAEAKHDPKLPLLTKALAARFLSTMIGVIRDRRFVSREDAERRAAVCLACPLHRETIGGCTNCAALFRKVERAMTGYPLDERLGWCGACGCKLSLKCWIDNRTLDRAEAAKPPYAEGCWRTSP